MTIPVLTEAAIRRQATAESFRRGQDYRRRGCVVSLVQRGHEIQAEVEGSQYEPDTLEARLPLAEVLADLDRE